MAILIVLLLYLLGDHVAQGTEDTCFSSAICYKADMHETTWRKISPPPQCTQNSPPAVESTNNIQIDRRLNRTIDKFFKRIADNCQACSSFENDVSSANAFSDVERCFAPVVCQMDGMSRTDFIQIQSFPTCAKDKKEVDDILMEREKLFNASRDYVATALQKHLLEICNPGCLSNKIQQVAKQIEGHHWKIHKGPKQCFAPVVCSAGNSSFQNWLKYPDCEYSAAILLSEEPENALSSILEVVSEDIRKLIAEECNGRICKEETMTAQSTVTTTKSTTTHADKISHQTTFAIQQGASARPETTVAFVDEMTTETDKLKPTPSLPKATTTTSLVSTTEIRVETSRETTTEEATTVTPTCGPLNKTSDCDIVYDGRCFFFYTSQSQDVSFQVAKQYCENHESQLGNIYDDCHYQYIMEIAGNARYNHWTGMKVSFSPSVDVILHSGESAIFWNDEWWISAHYPRPEDGPNLLITVALPFPPPQRRGILNADGNNSENRMLGAFCEKSLP